MTLPTVSIAVEDAGEVTDALARAERAVEAGAGLLEWRVDRLALAHGAAEHIGVLLDDAPAPVILTIRHVSEGGGYDGSDDDRYDLLTRLIETGRLPRYIDLEWASWSAQLAARGRLEAALKRLRTANDVHPSLILSVHDHDGRPRDLIQLIEAMTVEPSCAVIKVAWWARSVRDNLEIFDLLRERQKPTIALCMGPFGEPSRLLAARFGGLLTYLTDDPAHATAPGQPTLSAWSSIYGADRVDADTAVYGVVGWPVGHSESPRLHNRFFEYEDRNAIYLPWPVPPEPEHLHATLEALLRHEHLGLRGLSVTIPHKVEALRFVVQAGGVVEPWAERVGAANTITIDEAGRLHADNTDAPAARSSLEALLGDDRSLAGMQAAVLGAGGVAQALVPVLADAGARVVVFNRTPEHARSLADRFGVEHGPRDRLRRDRFDLYLNATPLGMTGGPDETASPLPDDAPLDEASVLFDTVYTPEITSFLRQGRLAGATVSNGADMLHRQAWLQWRGWTGGGSSYDDWRRVATAS